MHIRRLIILTLLVLCILPTTSRAQYKYTFRDSLGVYKVEFKPYANPREEARVMGRPVATGQHEIRLGMGAISDTPTSYTIVNLWNPASDYMKISDDNYFAGRTNWITLGLEGGRWFKDWLYVGGALVWTGGFDRLHHGGTHDLAYTYHSTNLSLMPTLRFAWVRRGIVQLYSGLGVGIAVAYNEEVYSNMWRFGVAYDCTVIGISVGRNIFGFFDVGAGMRGVMRFGIGYRFNKK